MRRAHDELARVDASSVAPLVDDEATTKDLIAKHRPTFPVGYGAAIMVAAVTSAFVDDDASALVGAEV